MANRAYVRIRSVRKRLSLLLAHCAAPAMRAFGVRLAVRASGREKDPAAGVLGQVYSNISNLMNIGSRIGLKSKLSNGKQQAHGPRTSADDYKNPQQRARSLETKHANRTGGATISEGSYSSVSSRPPIISLHRNLRAGGKVRSVSSNDHRREGAELNPKQPHPPAYAMPSASTLSLPEKFPDSLDLCGRERRSGLGPVSTIPVRLQTIEQDAAGGQGERRNRTSQDNYPSIQGDVSLSDGSSVNRTTDMRSSVHTEADSTGKGLVDQRQRMSRMRFNIYEKRKLGFIVDVA